MTLPTPQRYITFGGKASRLLIQVAAHQPPLDAAIQLIGCAEFFGWWVGEESTLLYGVWKDLNFLPAELFRSQSKCAKKPSLLNWHKWNTLCPCVTLTNRGKIGPSGVLAYGTRASLPTGPSFVCFPLPTSLLHCTKKEGKLLPGSRRTFSPLTVDCIKESCIPKSQGVPVT